MQHAALALSTRRNTQVCILLRIALQVQTFLSFKDVISLCMEAENVLQAEDTLLHISGGCTQPEAQGNTASLKYLMSLFV